MQLCKIASWFCIVWATPLAKGAAQAGVHTQSHWFSISGGVGIAGGSRYATVSERVAQAGVVFPLRGRRLEASVVGAWSETTVGCYASPCDIKPELAGGALSILKGIGWSNGREIGVASLGVGAYRLPGGAPPDGVRAALYPALQTGVEAAVPVAPTAAIVASTRIVVLPGVYGGQVVFAQFGVGVRLW